jgi:ABC-type transport system involved in cytochrome c biogenesis permease subunit
MGAVAAPSPGVVLDLHLLALALYGVATTLALAPFIGLSAAPRGLTIALPAAGAALHGVAISRLTLAGLAPALSMLALCLVLLQLAADRVLRVSTVAFFTGPLATGLVGLALLIGLGPGGGGHSSSARSAWSILHVTLSVLGVALLALAFIAAALYLLQFRELKSKRFGQVFQLFPPLERLDRLNYVALVIGFPAVTLGVLLGYGVRYGRGVPVDAAQIVWGTMTWLVLGWAVGVRVVRHWAGRRAAFASIAGFAAVVLVYLALKLAEPSAQRFL